MKKEKLVKTHESLEILEKKEKKRVKKLFSEKIKNCSDNIKMFVEKNLDFFILLIILLIYSSLFENMGISKTIPFALIIPFIFGSICSSKRKILLYSVTSVIILASVSKDATYAAYLVMYSTFLSFSGLYLAKYFENLKKYKILKKIGQGIFSLILIILSLIIHTNRFGMVGDYIEAKKALINYANEVLSSDYVYIGTEFDHNYNLYKGTFYNNKNDYCKVYFYYNTLKNEIVYGYDEFLKDKFNNQIIETFMGLVNESDISKKEFIEDIDINFSDSLRYNVNDDFDYKTSFDVSVTLKEIIEMPIDGDEIYENVRDTSELYFIKDQFERLSDNINKLEVKRINNVTGYEEILNVEYMNGNITKNVVDYVEIK